MQTPRWPNRMTGLPRSRCARLFPAPAVRINGPSRPRGAAPRRGLCRRSPLRGRLLGQRRDLRVGRRKRSLPREARLPAVRQAPPLLAPGRGQAAERADPVRARTPRSGRGLNPPIVGVGFSLGRRGGPAKIPGPRYPRSPPTMSRKRFNPFVTISTLEQTHIDNKRPPLPNDPKLVLGRGSWARLKCTTHPASMSSKISF
jgi:hypothetical protein